MGRLTGEVLSPVQLRAAAAALEFTVNVQRVLESGVAVDAESVDGGLLDALERDVLVLLASEFRELAANGGV